MTQSLQDVLREYESPLEFLQTVGPHADSGHLRLFEDVPPEFTNWREEQSAWVDSCAVSDLSHHMTDLRVEGPDALDLFEDFGANDFEGFQRGEAKQFVACNPNGYLIGDGILFRLAENAFNLVGYGPINWIQYNAETGDYDVTTSRNEHSGVRDGDPRDFRYQVQGPSALAVIRRALDEPLPDISFFNFEPVSVAGCEVNALRHGMINEPGFELFGPWEHADAVRGALMDAGEDHGITRVGRKAYAGGVIPAAWMSVPLPAIFGDEMRAYREWLDADSFEGALTVAGSVEPTDVTEHYLTPFGAGHDRFIEFDHEFVGRDALEAQADDPPGTKVTLVWNRADTNALVGHLFEDAEPKRYTNLPVPEWSLTQNDRVRKDGEDVGVANNTRYLYFERRMFSLCSIDPAYSDPGTEVTIVWGESGESRNPRVEPHSQTEIRATVGPAPYFEDKRKTADYSAV